MDLIEAVKNGNLETVQELLIHGADPDLALNGNLAKEILASLLIAKVKKDGNIDKVKELLKTVPSETKVVILELIPRQEVQSLKAICVLDIIKNNTSTDSLARPILAMVENLATHISFMNSLPPQNSLESANVSHLIQAMDMPLVN